MEGVELALHQAAGRICVSPVCVRIMFYYYQCQIPDTLCLVSEIFLFVHVFMSDFACNWN